MDLRELIAVLRTRWVSVVATITLGALLAIAVTLLMTPKYQSKVQFYVSVSAGDTAAAAYQGSLGAQQRVQSYAALVKSDQIAQNVVDITGVDLSAEEVAERVSAAANAETVLLEVAATDVDPQRAFTLAQGYGRVLPEVIDSLETPEGDGPPLATLTVVNPPKLPEAQVSPNAAQNVLIGILGGFIAGVGIALLRNMLDRRVTTKEQLESITGAPVVGAIPYRRSEDKESGAEHLVPFKEGHSPAAEAYRRLRTNLKFLNVDSPPRVIVLTSSVAAEGKSETTLNLAVALAESGSRVLLIEGDLRRPRVVTYMSMPDKVGFTTILSGRAELGDVVQETRHEGVDLLACGPLPPNPSELISSELAQGLIAEFRQKYDYVIIDSPPLLPVTDGALLSRITDGALLVTRTDRTTTDQVTQAVDNLRKADAQLLGVITVANRPARKGTSAYYDSYYYSSQKD